MFYYLYFTEHDDFNEFGHRLRSISSIFTLLLLQAGQFWENSQTQEVTYLSFGILNGHLQLTCQGATLPGLLI